MQYNPKTSRLLKYFKMAIISEYLIDTIPQLVDKVIGTTIAGPPDNNTVNFKFVDVLDMFLPEITLQTVLNAGNIATQNITLIGNISSTKIIPGNIQDETSSIGSINQVLLKTATGIKWTTYTLGSGINSLNGLTSAVQTFQTGVLGIDFNITSLGSIHTFNIPDASSAARGFMNTTSQFFVGTKHFVDDIFVNGINVGVGPGDINTNVRIGKNAGANLVSGGKNVMIGTQAGSGADVIGATVINSNLKPDGSTFNNEYVVNIGKQDSRLIAQNGFPHIWSPDVVFTANNTKLDVLAISNEAYASIFIDYTIQDVNYSQRSGTIKAVWNTAGNNIQFTEDATDSIGDTSMYIFNFRYVSGTNSIVFELINDSNTFAVYCNYTSRLLTKAIF